MRLRRDRRSQRQFREAIRLQPDNVVPYLFASVTTERIGGETDLSLRV